MDASKKKGQPQKKRAPARTKEGRENQLIDLAVDLAEEQLSKGTASAQVITHYLRLGTTREQLEKEKIRKENELLNAKTELIRSEKRVEELYLNALNAMRSYSGQGKSGGDEDIDDAEDN